MIRDGNSKRSDNTVIGRQGPVLGTMISPEDVRTWRQVLIRGILRVLTGLGALAVLGGSYSAYISGAPGRIAIYAGVYLVLVVIAFWRRVPYIVQVGTLLFLFYGTGLFTMSDTALSKDGGVALLTFSVLAALFLGQRGGIFALAVSILSMLAFGWAYSTGRLVVTDETLVYMNTTLTSWLSSMAVFLMLGSLLVISQNNLFARLTGMLTQSRELTQQLETARSGLEERVAERTQDLVRRARYLEATATVARDATSVLDVGELLARVANLVSERFDFYHTGLFLVDAGGEWAVLQAASSEGGQKMLARGHRLRVGEQGVVGMVAARGEPRIALDVGQDAVPGDGMQRDDEVYHHNPDLPETRSEIALPLRARGEVIGVLDVQSVEPKAFGTEDMGVLQTLADQVALAISNARLFNQAQESLEAQRRAYGELSAQAWQGLLRERPDLGFVKRGDVLLPASEEWDDEMEKAAQTGQVAQGSEVTLAVPIKSGERVIAVLDAHLPEGSEAWTPEQISLLESLTEQAAQAMERARLYRDTQRRAAQEQVVAAATGHIRESLDIETVLKTTASEVRQALDLDSLVIRLAAPEAGRATAAMGTSEAAPTRQERM